MPEKNRRIMENQNKPKEKRRRKHLCARVLLSQLKQMRETGWTMPLHPWPLEHHIMMVIMITRPSVMEVSP